MYKCVRLNSQKKRNIYIYKPLSSSSSSDFPWKDVISPLTKVIWKSLPAVLWELVICRNLDEYRCCDRGNLQPDQVHCFVNSGLVRRWRHVFWVVLIWGVQGALLHTGWHEHTNSPVLCNSSLNWVLQTGRHLWHKHHIHSFYWSVVKEHSPHLVWEELQPIDLFCQWFQLNWNSCRASVLPLTNPWQHLHRSWCDHLWIVVVAICNSLTACFGSISP